MCNANDIRVKMYLEEYQIRNNDCLRASDGFNAQSKFAQMYITVLFVVVAYLLNWSYQNDNIGNIHEYIGGIIVIFLTLPAIYTYLHALILVSAREFYISRYRMAVIEQKLNEITGVDAPIWESKIITNFQSPHFAIKEGYLNPAWWLAAWALISSGLVQALLVILCFSIYKIMGQEGAVFPKIYVAYVSFLLVSDFSLHFYILTKGEAAIKKRVEILSGVREPEEGKVKKPRKKARR